MSTESISITVDADAARSFFEATPEERRKMEILLGLRLRELTSSDARSVRQIMDEISSQANAKGLAPDMVESILRDE